MQYVRMTWTKIKKDECQLVAQRLARYQVGPHVDISSGDPCLPLPVFMSTQNLKVSTQPKLGPLPESLGSQPSRDKLQVGQMQIANTVVHPYLTLPQFSFFFWLIFISFCCSISSYKICDTTTSYLTCVLKEIIIFLRKKNLEYTNYFYMFFYIYKDSKCKSKD